MGSASLGEDGPASTPAGPGEDLYREDGGASPSPLVSVVIPAFNAAATIEDCVRSVLAQTVESFEVIVVDDGSTDDTLDRVGAFRDVRIRTVDGAHGGAGAARNRGIAAARGTYVSFLDSDDLWLPGYLEGMLATLEASPDAGFAFTDAWFVDAETLKVRRASVCYYPEASRPPSDPVAFLSKLIERNFVYTSVTVRRATLEEVGGFDESLTASIDYELWLRIAAHGRRGLRAPGLLCVYRGNRAGSISSSRLRVVEGMIAVHRLVAERYPVGDAERMLALRCLADEEEERASLVGDRSTRSRWLRLKPRLAGARDRLLARRTWYAEVPPELAVAVPWLFGQASPEPMR